MSEDEQSESKEAEVESKEAEVESPEVAKEQMVESRATPSRAGRDPNVVYVGNKPPMNYVMAVMTAFNMGSGTDVTLKARGRAISTAVDVAEITRNRFFKETKVHAISIGTEEITPREGGNPRNVSTIEINLKK
jgi:DNA-binding protein